MTELTALIIICFIFLLTLSFIVPLLMGLFRGAPYIASTDSRTATILDFAKIQSGEKMVDLGSGNGKLLIAFARAGAIATGYEINPWLVAWAKWRVWRSGVADRVTIHWQSFWRQNLTDYDVVVTYLLPKTMVNLQPLLESQTKPSVRIISNAFILPDWKPLKTANNVYLYRKA